MARTKTDGKSVDGGTGKPSLGGNGRTAVRWSNPYINADDNKWLEDHMHEHMAWVGKLLNALTPEYNLSVKFDFQSGRTNAILFCNDGHSPNNGCALSIRGAGPTMAVYALSYFALVHFEGEPWLAENRPAGSLWG